MILESKFLVILKFTSIFIRSVEEISNEPEEIIKSVDKANEEETDNESLDTQVTSNFIKWIIKNGVEVLVNFYSINKIFVCNLFVNRIMFERIYCWTTFGNVSLTEINMHGIKFFVMY